MVQYRHDFRIHQEGGTLSNTVGVYRSEKFVVIERYAHRFPQSCIWCNSPVPGSNTPAAAGDAPVRPPVCDTCAATRSRLPKVVAVFGATALIAALVLYFTSGMFPAATLFLGGLTGLVIAYRLQIAARGFRAAHEDNQYVWIAGASRRFLETLPAWHGMKLAELCARGN
jgi:hypothetical protein